MILEVAKLNYNVNKVNFNVGILEMSHGAKNVEREVKETWNIWVSDVIYFIYILYYVCKILT